MVYVIYLLLTGSSKRQLHSASRMMKIIQLAGILYSVIVKLILDKNLV